jgi:hypothetical protein
MREPDAAMIATGAALRDRLSHPAAVADLIKQAAS